MWSICYPYLGGTDDGTPVWEQMINPPICAIFVGLFVSAIPGATGILYADQPIMNGLMQGLIIMGDAAVPLSIIVLGGNLWFAARSSEQIPLSQVSLISRSVCWSYPCLRWGCISCSIGSDCFRTTGCCG